MKTIPLTKGKVAFVDDFDYDSLLRYKWCASQSGNLWYARRRTKQTYQYMHHFLLEPRGKQIDHIDGNGLNNQRNNIHIVTSRENHQNLHIKKSSRYPGVSWVHNSTDKVWQSRIMVNMKSKYLGNFSTEEDAFDAYKKVANTL